MEKDLDLKPQQVKQREIELIEYSTASEEQTLKLVPSEDPFTFKASGESEVTLYSSSPAVHSPSLSVSHLQA
jgi:hypothetical protein